MSKKEAVLLVSRAFAMIQLISALLELTYLPDRLLSLHHYVDRISRSVASQQDFYLRSSYQFETAFLLARIAILLSFAFAFWFNGPWVERILSPKLEGSQPSS